MSRRSCTWLRAHQVAGDDYAGLAKKFPTPPASAGIVFDADEGCLGEEAFVRDCAGDLPEAKARALSAVQWPFHKALLTCKDLERGVTVKTELVRRGHRGSTINPDLQRFMAKRMGAKTIKASHVLLISQPETMRI
jgi:hypothetical protein